MAEMPVMNILKRNTAMIKVFINTRKSEIRHAYGNKRGGIVKGLIRIIQYVVVTLQCRR